MLNEKIENIETDLEFEKFKRHVDIENNNRIIFSAPFGSGKTYFLKNFLETHSEEYIPLFINPVKYSISSNKDIFELIKFDLIVQLLQNGYLSNPSSKSDFDNVSTEWFLSNELFNNKIEFVAELSTAINLLNPDSDVSGIATLTKILPSLLNTFKKLSERKKAHTKKTKKNLESAEEKLLEYLKNQTKESGHPYELDEVTDILRELISDIKGSSVDKKTVLVIDDFDRLDPEHIFRVLNVLSVHNDTWYNGNKFGFDKIIIACDIENIEELFKHRYGTNSDFSGYIDKFCSTHFYRFSIEKQILSYLQEKVRPQEAYSTNKINHQLHLLTVILSYYIRYKRIKLRNILKANFDLPSINKQIIHSEIDPVHFISSKHIHVLTDDILFLRTLKILISIWGDVNNFISDLNTTQHKNKRLSTHCSTEIIDEALKALALPMHITYAETATKLVLRINQNGHLDYPEVNLCNVSYKIIHGYSNATRYDGSDSFFANTTITACNYNGENKSNITYSELFASIVRIISEFRQKNYLKDFDY